MYLKSTLLVLQLSCVLTASILESGVFSTIDSSSVTNMNLSSGQSSSPVSESDESDKFRDTRFFFKCSLADMAAGPRTAVVVIQGPNPLLNTITGVVTFSQVECGRPVSITGTISGTALTPGLHGWHVHERGDLTNGCTSTLAHFNPFNQAHGAPAAFVRHVGDLGNIVASGTNVAIISVTDNRITLFGPNSIIGRGLTIHAQPDDFVTQPTGNSGGRIGCGVIGFQS